MAKSTKMGQFYRLHQRRLAYFGKDDGQKTPSEDELKSRNAIAISDRQHLQRPKVAKTQGAHLRRNVESIICTPVATR